MLLSFETPLDDCSMEQQHDANPVRHFGLTTSSLSLSLSLSSFLPILFFIFLPPSTHCEGASFHILYKYN